MQHLLFDAQAAKTTQLILEGSTLITRTEADGKSKSTNKSFADSSEATQQFVKKEWELLKKGAVMRTTDAKAGDPLMHVFIGAGYTGCLSFVATPYGIYVYQPGGSGREMGIQDNLLRITRDGTVDLVITLPGLLPWDICYDPQLNQLLIDLDHYIYQYDIAKDSFTRLTKELKLPASFVAVGANTQAYATHPFYYVNHNNQLRQMELDAEIVKGSIPLAASLSPDGEVLALHNREGNVQLIDTKSISVFATLQGDFGKAEQIIWTKDSTQLIVHDRYSSSTPLHFFDRVTGNETRYEELAFPSASQDVTDCCLNADNTLLVCLKRSTAFVFDFAAKKFLYSFVVYHCVKTAQIKFIDDRTLAARTDYGCFSIYQLS